MSLKLSREEWELTDGVQGLPSRAETSAEITSLRAQLDEARRKAIEECAIIAEHTWSLGDATAEGHGGEAAGKSIARRIRALLSESKT